MTSSTLSPSIRIFLILIIVTIFYFIYVASSRGVGDVVAHQSRIIMDEWASGKKTVDKREWNAAHQSLLSALKLSPGNPDYLALLGNLYEWRVANKSLNSQETALEVIADYRMALEFYRRALKQRPAYAFYWANIAVVKSILGEVDQEYYQAIERALVLGPWEPGVQLKIADATLGVWYLLDDNGWDKMLTNVERGLESNPTKMMTIAKQAQVLNKLCGKLRRTEIMREYCK